MTLIRRHGTRLLTAAIVALGVAGLLIGAVVIGVVYTIAALGYGAARLVYRPHRADTGVLLTYTQWTAPPTGPRVDTTTLPPTANGGQR